MKLWIKILFNLTNTVIKPQVIINPLVPRVEKIKIRQTSFNLLLLA